jgi:gluconokinase
VIVIISGVSGSGKTTVGAMLAGRLGWPFADADDFHPAANVEKMRAGIPLTDEDRWPWLRAIAAWMDEHIARGSSPSSAARRSGVPTGTNCSAAIPRPGWCSWPPTATCSPGGSPPGPVTSSPETLLASQLAALEPPGPDEQVIRVVPADTAAGTVDAIIALLFPPGSPGRDGDHEAEA